MTRTLSAVLLLGCIALAACGSSGPVRRVSEPAASIQQLTGEGDRSVALRPDRTGRADGQIRRRPYGSGAPIHSCSSRAKSSFWVARISRTNDLAHCSQQDVADS